MNQVIGMNGGLTPRTGVSNEKPIDYSKGVPIARDVETGELVRINFTGRTRLLLAAETGGGKTVMGKGIISRLHDMSYNVVHASDSKNDMRSVDNLPGASKKLMNETEGLARGEERHPIPVEMFAPKFLYDLYVEKEYDRQHPPDYLTQFTLPFNLVSRDDFKYLMHPDTQTQREHVDSLVNSVGDWQKTGFHELESIAESLDSDTIKRKLRNIKENNVIGGRTAKNPLDKLGEAVVTISVRYMDEMRAEFGMRPLYLMIAAVLREWGQLGMQGVYSNPSLLFLDECHDVIPANRDSRVKVVVEKLMSQVARQMDMAMVFGTQKPSKMPSKQSSDGFNFLGSCNHIFLGPNMDEAEWKPVLKSTNLYNPHRLQRWRDIFNRMNQFNHPFLYINPERHFSPSDTRIVRSLSPLVSHPG